jgi:hypothetical protein
MKLSRRVVRFSSAACLLGCLALAYGLGDTGASTFEGTLPTTLDTSMDTTRANELIQRQPGFFVPNLGQWDHPASFVHRSGPMTLFLEDRGWVIDMKERPKAQQSDLIDRVDRLGGLRRPRQQSSRGVAVRMSFVGSNPRPKIVGKGKLPGYCNYFLGSDESRWRTDVPRHTAVRYEDMYPGIDVRMRSVNGHPEYDLLCEAGSDLSDVRVEVEGADALTVDEDGCLRIDTSLGPIRQPKPNTWECLDDGRRRFIECEYVLLGSHCFGFAARDRNGANALVVDPGLLWSTYLGGSGFSVLLDMAYAVHVDAQGVVTLAGWTRSPDFPTTTGAYDRSHNGGSASFPNDAFVSRMDPRKTGTAQLLYSTFLGSSGSDQGLALAVDPAGVITVAGSTGSSNFPTTANAFDTTFNGGSYDGFVSRLDTRLVGTAQLIYSTFLGGSASEAIWDVSISPAGFVSVAGGTGSRNYPTTRNAFNTAFNGGIADAFVSRLDLSKVGTAQLTYSTFLGGKGYEVVRALAVDVLGNVNVAGGTISTNFPTTTGAFDTSFNGGTDDGFACRLDLNRVGSAQLTYSTYLGGSAEDLVTKLSVDIIGGLTVAGWTASTNFPTTARALDTTYNGGYRDSFVSRLNPIKLGKGQLVYSTFLGGSTQAGGSLGGDGITGLAVDADGVVTVSGWTNSADFPTTRGAYDTKHDGAFDIFASRLDPRLVGSAQLVYSTFLGGSSSDHAEALAVDASGVVTVSGWTVGFNNDYPTTPGAYSVKRPFFAAIVSRLDMGVALYGDVHAISIKTGGKQKLTVNAGKAHANRLYWIFGSITGTKPGVNLLGVHIPLNPDLYTNVAMASVNTTAFTKFRGTLDANGLATASFVVPANLSVPAGFAFHHAYVVYDASGRFYMAGNAVPLTMRK